MTAPLDLDELEERLIRPRSVIRFALPHIESMALIAELRQARTDVAELRAALHFEHVDSGNATGLCPDDCRSCALLEKFDTKLVANR